MLYIKIKTRTFVDKYILASFQAVRDDVISWDLEDCLGAVSRNKRLSFFVRFGCLCRKTGTLTVKNI